MPEKPFEIYEEDFRKTAMDFLMFKNGIDAKTFNEKLVSAALYSSEISQSDDSVSIVVKVGENDGED